MSSLMRLIEMSTRKLAEARELKHKTSLRVLNDFGSTDAFRKSLIIKKINRAKQPEFADVYAFYKKFFTLPNETESYKGFEKTLTLNTNQELQDKFGRFEESWLYAVNKVDNQIVAGVNFAVYCPVEGEVIHSQYGGTAHIIYLFVEPAYRGMGLATHLLKLAEEHAMQFAKQTLPLLFFCEQNAPELMSAEAYFKDNANALVDQCDRLIWWHKAGYQRLMFNYVQPPLNHGQRPCTDLTLNVRTIKHTLPANLITFHLERFFLLAVFKAQLHVKDKLYKQQLDIVTQIRTIRTIGSALYYRRLKRHIFNVLENWRPLEKLY